MLLNLFQNQGRLFLISLFILVFIGTLSWEIQNKIETSFNAELAESLETIRDATHRGVTSWVEAHKTAAEVWANHKQVRGYTEQLIGTSHTRKALIESSVQGALRHQLLPVKTIKGYQGYFVIGPDNINLASSRDSNVGIENLLSKQSQFLQAIWDGNTAISLPVNSDVPLPDKDGNLKENLPTMFVGAPVKNHRGEIIAIFTFRLDPSTDFSKLLQQGRIGRSGETYAFDNKGLMLSNSRFDQQLREAGLLKRGQNSILNINLRDPGVNLTIGQRTVLPRDKQPITHMAKLAVSDNTGVNLDGYNDYRGVPVVSAWVWDTELGFGLATELDLDEAYQTLRAINNSINTLTALLVVVWVGLTAVFILYQLRREAVLSLCKSEEKYRGVFESILDVYAEIDLNGTILEISPSVESISGYSRAEMVGREMADFYANPEDRNRLLEYIYLHGAINDYEVQFIDKAGNKRPFSLTGKIVLDEKGVPSKMAGVMRDISERKRSEEALRHSEEMWRSLTENSPDHILTLDNNLNIQFLNYASPGLKKEELIGTPLYRYAYADKQEEVKSILEKALSTGEPCSYETKFETPDGEIIYYESIVAPRVLSDVVVGLTVNARNITERKEAEKELQRSEVLEHLTTGASLHEILESLVLNAEKLKPEVLGIVSLLDEHGKHLTVGAAPSLPGYMKEALDGLEIGENVCACGAAAYRGERVVTEDVLNHPNWKSFLELAERSGLRSCWSEPVISSGGNVLGTFAVCYREKRLPQQYDFDFIRDSARLAGIAIERKQVEETIKEERDKAQRYLDTVEAMMIALDAKGNITLANRKACELLGYHEDELIGKNWFTTCLPESLLDKGIYAVFEKIIEGEIESKEHYINPIVTRSGEERTIAWHNNMLRDEQGDIVGTLSAGEDITERRQAEERAKQHLMELAHVSRLSLIGETATEIAHEVNQPLTIIASYGDTLRRILKSDSWSAEELDLGLEEITSQAHRASEIIKHLRSFVKKDPVPPSELDVNQVILGVLQLVRGEPIWENIEIELQLHESLPSIYYDKILLEQVVLNLIRNAGETMSDSDCQPSRLTIDTSVNEDEAIEVGVTDTGPSITEEELEKIFEPFYTTKKHGMGMGLSICRSIIEEHGGMLWAEAKPENGVSIRFTILPAELEG